jgi:hypothetical protein
VLREVRDGLDDATRALVDSGCSPAHAARTAVTEFGSPDVLAPEFQRELAVSQARWTAAWTALALPALWLAWDLTWTTAPDLGIPSPTVMVLARMTDVIGLGTALLCLAALVFLELGGRRLREPERIAKAVAGVSLVGSLGVLATSAGMTALNVPETFAVSEASTVYQLVGAVSVFALVVMLRSAVRCARAAEVRAPHPASHGADQLSVR